MDVEVKGESPSLEEVSAKFNELKRDLGEKQSPVLAAIRTLIHFIRLSQGSTVSYLVNELQRTVRAVRNETGRSKLALAVASASAQFIRYVTLSLANFEAEDMAACKNRIETEGVKFLRRCERSVDKISKLGAPFIFDGAQVLVHSNSRVVLETLKAVPENIHFKVFATNSEPEKSVDDYSMKLKGHPNIECVIIHDSEVAYIMETIDLVLVGAEAVVKNGGIINKVGTLSLGICAKEMNKPLYVVAESFKFSLLYPLNQSDIPDEFRLGKDKKVRVDYTPPKYLTLLITDRGLLTPTAVCDELIEIYI